MKQKSLTIAVMIIVLACACATAPRMLYAGADAAKVIYDGPLPQNKIPQYITAAVNSPDRPAADKKLDPMRRPEQFLAFYGIKPGMHVADLWAGGGYTTELLARTVGATGKVYSQNQPFPPKFKKAEDAWKARLKEPGMTNVVEVLKPFSSNNWLPVKPGTLDAVTIVMNYHDMVGRDYDRAKINHEVFTALKKGGVYAIVDNRAPGGSGARDASTIHRIAEDYVINEVGTAGFRLAASSDILCNPRDDRTLPFWKMNHEQDRFTLKFVKP
ncbi:MAG: class I SAM-dependent methyltransferase [Candidatus Binataceae bacterium]